MSASQGSPQDDLLRLIQPMLALVARLEPQSRTDPSEVAALEQALHDHFDPEGPEVKAVGNAIRQGVADGWLCNRGDPDSRFSRLSKPSDATYGLSVDVVSMIGGALEHTHPAGEITLGFAADPRAGTNCRFDNRPPGWVFLPPGSRHVPHVDGSRMYLIYFLPDGAVQWHPPS